MVWEVAQQHTCESPVQALLTRSRFRSLQWDVKIHDFFPQGVTVKSEQFRRLYLIASRLPQCRRDERTFHRGNQDRMKVFSRSVSHPLHEFSHFHF